jgi:hypothetical protein
MPPSVSLPLGPQSRAPVGAPGAQLLRRGTGGLRRAPFELRPSPGTPGPPHPHTECRASLCRKCMHAVRTGPARVAWPRRTRPTPCRATHTRRGARRQGAGGSTRSGIGACRSSPTADLAGRVGRCVGIAVGAATGSDDTTELTTVTWHAWCSIAKRILPKKVHS